MPRLVSILQGPDFGGPHNQLVTLRGALEEAGWDAVAVVDESEGNAAARLEGAGIATHAVRLGRLRAGAGAAAQLRYLAGLAGDLRRLRALLRELSPDVVEAHGAVNLQGGVAAHREGIAVVWQLLDTRAPMALLRVTMPVVTRAADVIAVWGDALARFHPGARRLGERVVTVFPPVDPGKFRPDAERRARAREELGVPADAFLAGTVANLNPQKGHEHVVRAFALARREAPELHLRILGAPTPGHEGYRAKIESAAERAGLGPPEFGLRDPGVRVAELLPALDLFVLGSVHRSEGMPTVILEAASSGLAVLATDVGAVAEMVEDRRSGLVVPPEDPEALAAAMTTLAGDPSLRASLAAEGLRRAREGFSLERCAERHLRAYEMARRHRAGRARPRRGSRS